MRITLSVVPFVLLAFAAGAPVWIGAQGSGGLIISWEKKAAPRLDLVVQTPDSENTYELDRPAGTIIVPTPPEPYRIVYRSAAGDPTTLAEAGVFPLPKPQMTAPALPARLRSALGRSRKSVDLFVKIDPSGKVAGTSYPYYPDRIRRELASLASDTAVKQWRFGEAEDGSYRDRRVHFSFDSNGARILRTP